LHKLNRDDLVIDLERCSVRRRAKTKKVEIRFIMFYFIRLHIPYFVTI